MLRGRKMPANCSRKIVPATSELAAVTQAQVVFEAVLAFCICRYFQHSTRIASQTQQLLQERKPPEQERPPSGSAKSLLEATPGQAVDAAALRPSKILRSPTLSPRPLQPPPPVSGLKKLQEAAGRRWQAAWQRVRPTCVFGNVHHL